MKNQQYRWNVWGLVLVAGLVSGCASTQVKTATSEPGFDVDVIHKALVVGITRTPEMRKAYEEELVRQWKARGVDAVSSLQVLPPNTTLDKAGVGPLAKSGGYDVVLVSRLIRHQPIDSSAPNRSGTPNDYTEIPPDNTNMNQYFHAVVASPGDDVSYVVFTITTTVFSVATEQKVWSCVTETLVTGDTMPLVPGFVKVILKTLYAPPKRTS